MNEAIHSIHLALKALAEADERAAGIIDAQRYQLRSLRALRDEVKRLKADVARQMYTKRAPLPATRTGRCGDDR